MSDSTNIYGKKPASLTPQGDYREPIARTGEQQFAAIVRQRSGMDAGNIDGGTRDISHLSDADKQDAVEAAYSIYERFRDATGMRARRDVAGVIHEGEGSATS